MSDDIEPVAEDVVDPAIPAQDTFEEDISDSKFRYVALLALGELLDSDDETMVFDAASLMLEHTA